MTSPKITDVFFVVDGNRLEAQACLLAPSLRRHLSASQRAVAYVRQDYLPHLLPFTRDVLHASGVEIREIPNTDKGHAPWAAPYPQGNKILAASTPRDCDVSVFLDTDMIMAEPVSFSRMLGAAQIGAVVSDYQASAGQVEDWEHFYDLFGMELPAERVQLHGGRREWRFRTCVERSGAFGRGRPTKHVRRIAKRPATARRAAWVPLSTTPDPIGPVVQQSTR